MVAALKTAAADAPDLESRLASQALLRGYSRLVRWKRIVPKASAEVLEALAHRPTRTLLASLFPLLPQDEPAKEHAIVALTQEILAGSDPLLGVGLLELLAFLDRRTCGRLVALIRTGKDSSVRRCAAGLLVAVAQKGGSKESVRRLMRLELRDQRLQTGPVTRAIVSSGDLDLWQEMGGAEVVPLPALQQWFLQNPGADPDQAGLLSELSRFLRKRGGGK